MSTENGKRAVKLRGLFGGETEVRAAAWVGMIEAEAVAAERARIRAEVLAAGMFEGCGGMGRTEERNDELAAVLAIVEEP